MLERLFQIATTVVLLGALAACGDVQDDRSDLRSLGSTASYPNLEALPADNLYLEKQADGTTILLRFDTTSWNKGAGPLELVAGDPVPCDGGSCKEVFQVVYDDSGNVVETHQVGTFTYHAEEGHDHFHFDNYAIYKLQDPKVADAAVASGAKTSFCIMDTDRVNHRLPGAPKRAQYASCGDAVQGMSVGWGDTYKAGLAGQWIDVTNVTSGIYDLYIHVNPKVNADGGLLEASDTGDSENVSVITLDLQIDPNHSDGGTVSVVEDSDGDESGGGPPGNGNCPRC